MELFFCILGWLFTGVFFLLFIILAWRSNLLRDEINNPAAFMTNAANWNIRYKGMAYEQIPRPFSLARTQFAVWTVVVAPVYLYHLLCAGCKLPLANSTTPLLLLIISAGTTAIATIIDKKNGRARSTTPRHQNGPSQGFVYDILADRCGISIHRLQYVVWTLVLILVYLARAASAGCVLPEMGGTLLALNGISSAVYLGLKIYENK